MCPRPTASAVTLCKPFYENPDKKRETLFIGVSYDTDNKKQTFFECLLFIEETYQSLYSNIKSYMHTVSPSLTPIRSMRSKTPESRSIRSKYMRLS